MWQFFMTDEFWAGILIGFVVHVVAWIFLEDSWDSVE